MLEIKFDLLPIRRENVQELIPLRIFPYSWEQVW